MKKVNFDTQQEQISTLRADNKQLNDDMKGILQEQLRVTATVIEKNTAAMILNTEAFKMHLINFEPLPTRLDVPFLRNDL